MLYERIKKEHARLEEEIKSIKKKISAFPQGKLICTHGKDGFRWYNSDGHNRTYIPKRERHLAENLALKKYYSIQLEEMEQERRALKCYLHHHAKVTGKTQKLLEDVAYQQLLQFQIQPASAEARSWMDTPYERNRNYPEKLIPTIQLITTYETLESPLSIETIGEVLHKYFL